MFIEKLYNIKVMTKCKYCLTPIKSEKRTTYEVCYYIVEERSRRGKCMFCGDNDVKPFLALGCDPCGTQPNPKGFPYV